MRFKFYFDLLFLLQLFSYVIHVSKADCMLACSRSAKIVRIERRSSAVKHKFQMAVLVRRLFRRDVPEVKPPKGSMNLFIENPCGEPMVSHMKIRTGGQPARLRCSFGTFLVRQEKYTFLFSKKVDIKI